MPANPTTAGQPPTVHAILTPAAFDQVRIESAHLGNGRTATTIAIAGINFRVAGMGPLDLHEAILNLAADALCSQAAAVAAYYAADSEPELVS